MKKISLTFIFLFFCTSNLGLTKICHYTCQTCTQPFRQTCKTCSYGTSFLMVKDPSITTYPYRDSASPTGLCQSNDEPSRTNALGIILLISALILIPVTRSSQVFYIVYTLQSLSLWSFIEIGWLKPVQFIIGSLQYLTPCNIITTSLKQESLLFNQQSFYNLNRFFVEPSLQKSLSLLGILNIIVFVIIINLHIIRKIRATYFAQQCRSVICCTDWVLARLVNYFKCLYFLLIQQTTMSIVIAFQFQTPITSFTIGVTVVYLIMTAAFLYYIYKFKIRLFPNRFVQFFSVIKKIIFPIFVVVPFNFQFFLIILMAITCILEAFFDRQIHAYEIKSRKTVFKIVELLLIVLCGAFYAADTHSTSPTPPLIFNYLFTLFLSIGIFFLYLESVLAIKERYEKKKINVQDSKKLVPEISIVDREQNSTFMPSQTKREQTEDNIVQGQRQNEHDIVSEVIKQEIDDDEIMPPQVERENTKDSSFKNSESDHKQIIEQRQEQNKYESIKQKQEKKKQKNEQLRAEMKKRYGV